MKTLTRPAPTALAPPTDAHWILVLEMFSQLVSVVRLGYHLPKAEFEALLDHIYKDATQTVLEHLRR